MQCFGATAQDGSVAGFQAQGGGIGSHVRAGFVNDADDAQRHPHPPDLNARWTILEIGNFAHRIGLRCDFPQALRHPFDVLGGELQTIQQRGIQAGGPPGLHIQAISGAQGVFRLLQGIGDSQQGSILAPRLGTADNAGSRAGTPADFGHVTRDGVGNIHVGIHR